MTLYDLLDAQYLLVRAYVRNVMFFATLPYYLAEEHRPHDACNAGTLNLSDGPDR